MQCPSCKSTNLNVSDTRRDAISVNRRRVCQECSTKFSTVELIKSTATITIVGSSQSLYSHDRLVHSLQHSNNRQFDESKIISSVNDIEKMLINTPKRTIKLPEFIRKTADILSNFDPVMAIRFISHSSLQTVEMSEALKTHTVAANASAVNSTVDPTKQIELNFKKR